MSPTKLASKERTPMDDSQMTALLDASHTRRRKMRREENRQAWAAYFGRLASSLRDRADDYDRRAMALLAGAADAPRGADHG